MITVISQGNDARAISRQCVEPPRWASADLVIRRYERADHDKVIALHRTALATVGLRPGDGVYYDDDFDRMEEIYLRGDGEFLVGERPGAGGEIVAMGGLRAPRADTPAHPCAEPLLLPSGVPRPAEPIAEMVRLRVHPRWQRRGYGLAVVTALEERARELGYRLLRGDTTDRQQPALALYRGCGWKETHRRLIGGIVNVYLEKPLCNP